MAALTSLNSPQHEVLQHDWCTGQAAGHCMRAFVKELCAAHKL